MLINEVVGTCAEQVKAATRAAHERAEAVMMPLLEAAVNPESYGALLQHLYAFYMPMERLLQPFASSLYAPGINFERSPLLAADLAVLGSDLPSDFCTELPAISNETEALGALYVLEGAALGGRVIARMLGAHLAIPPEAIGFFNGREGGTGPHWKNFVQLMNQHASNPMQHAVVSEVAQATFEAHTRWMKTI